MEENTTVPVTTYPMTGRKVPSYNSILPPDWGLDYHEYRALITNSIGFDRTGLLISSLISALFTCGLIFGTVPNQNGVAQPGEHLFIFSAILLVISGVVTGGFIYGGARRHLSDTSVLGTLDPTLVLDLDEIPNEIQTLLGGDYDAAIPFVQHIEDTPDWSVTTMLEALPDEIDALIRRGMSSMDFHTRNAAAGLQGSVNYHRTGATQSSADVAARPSVRPNQRTVWADAVTTHDRVIEAWTHIVTDPLEVLTHSALMDMNERRSAEFMDLYGTIQDFRVVHGIAFPLGDEAAVREYVSLVRKTDEAWTEALRYSTHVGFDWLPADEEKAARQAAAAMALARDENAETGERVAAAENASRLMKKVKSFLLPPGAMHALETQTRLALPVGTATGSDILAGSVGDFGAPVLRVVPEGVVA